MTGKDIRHIRRLGNLTQEQLARMAKVTSRFICQVECGYTPRYKPDRLIRIQNLIKDICKVIECPHPYVVKCGFQEGVGMLYNCVFCGSTITINHEDEEEIEDAEEKAITV